MIKGERRLDLEDRIRRIFSRISEYDIYRYYLGEFTINEMFCNPLRQENHPSMEIREIDNRLFHRDYGDFFYRGGYLDLVRQKYYCSNMDAVAWIERDFGINDEGGRSGERIVTWEQPKVAPKKPPKINVVTRRPNQEELKWWADRLQGLEDLKREHIYFPKDIYRNYKRLPSTPMTFCYYYPVPDRWKLYRPLMNRRTKDTPVHQWKWDTNLEFTAIENLEGVKGREKALLVGKKKDRMYLSKVLETDAIANVQAEDPACLSDEALEIFQAIPERWINGDNDKKGKEFSQWLTTHHGFRHINVPDDAGVTDFVDWGVPDNHQIVLNHFKTKGFI